jgi:hypothetical protein
MIVQPPAHCPPEIGMTLYRWNTCWMLAFAASGEALVRRAICSFAQSPLELSEEYLAATLITGSVAALDTA